MRASCRKKAELIKSGYSTLESFTHPVCFWKKLSEKDGHPENYERILLHSCMVQRRSALYGERHLIVALNETRWNPMFSSAIQIRDTKNCKWEMLDTRRRGRFL